MLSDSSGRGLGEICVNRAANEVRRASEAPRGVSAGLEKGWLTFVCTEEKRRLAPFPADWVTMSERELERLCASARVANAPRYPVTGVGVPRRGRAAPEGSAAMPDAPTPNLQGQGGDDPVQQTVRDFAHEARASRMPAIEAMVRLKAVLLDRFRDPAVPADVRATASDMRSIRRWFVEAYYFERQAEASGRARGPEINSGR